MTEWELEDGEESSPESLKRVKDVKNVRNVLSSIERKLLAHQKAVGAIALAA